MFHWLCFTCADLLQKLLLYWHETPKSKNVFPWSKTQKLLHKKDTWQEQDSKWQNEWKLPKPSTTAPPSGRSVKRGSWPLANVSQHTTKITKITALWPVPLLAKTKTCTSAFCQSTTEARHGGSVTSTALLATANAKGSKACQNISSLSRKSLHNKSYKNKAISTWKNVGNRC